MVNGFATYEINAELELSVPRGQFSVYTS